MLAENEKALGEALKNDEETIELEGALAERIKRIYQLNHVLWCLCVVSLAVAAAALLAAPASAGTSSAVSLAAAAPAAAAMGAPAAVTAALTAAAGGGVHVLRKLRERTMKELKNGHIVLYLRRRKE